MANQKAQVGITFPASIAAVGASLNIPHGVAPTTPVNGDVWTTTTGIFVRINGTTYGPLADNGPGATASTLTGLQVGAGGSAATWSRSDHQHTVAGVVDLTTTQSIGGAKTATGQWLHQPGTDTQNIILRNAIATPTANLMDFATNTGTVLASFDSAASLKYNGSTGSTITSGQLRGGAPTTDVIPMIARGWANATAVADLQVWQGGASSTTVGSVGYDGSSDFINQVSNNFFRNGQMSIHQRGGTIAATTAADTYTLDGWFVKPATTTVNVSRGDTTAAYPTIGRYNLSITPASGTTAFYVGQRIESIDCTHLGQKCTFSMWVFNGKASGALATPTVTLSNPTTTSDTFSALTAFATAAAMTLVAGSTAISTWSQWAITVDLSGASTALTRGLDVKFNMGAIATGTDSIQITDVKLEIGTKVTPTIPLPHPQELARCQRYYYRVVGGNYVGNCVLANQFRTNITAPQPLRTGAVGAHGITAWNTGTTAPATTQAGFYLGGWTAGTWSSGAVSIYGGNSLYAGNSIQLQLTTTANATALGAGGMIGLGPTAYVEASAEL